jgi:molybdenum cofactor cytidylyltransferase
VPVTCIVLAAGASTRLGRPKQLADFQGEKLVVRAARIAASVGPTMVVIPAHAPAIEQALKTLNVWVVENNEADEGMASSIRRGLDETSGDVLITLCDQPLVTTDHLRALVAARAPIAATGYKGISGVPAFFATKFREELLSLRGDSGARRVIDAHRDEVVTVPFEPAGFDVDTDAALSL